MASDEAAARAAQPAAVPALRPSLASYVQEHDELDELTEASSAVVDMVHAGNLDAAGQAAHDLLARFPDVHDGYDRLGMVCKARGDHRQAADYYRRAINVIRDHPENYDPGFEDLFQKLVDRLETQANAAAGSACGPARRFIIAGCWAASRHPRLRRGASLTPPALPAVLSAGRRRGMVPQSHQGMSRKKTLWIRRDPRGTRNAPPQNP